VHCGHKTVELLRREMPDFMIASSLWLPNIADFSPVDYLENLDYGLCGESGHCDMRGTINNMCKMLMNWSNVWLYQQTVVISDDLGWEPENLSKGQWKTFWKFDMSFCCIALYDTDVVYDTCRPQTLCCILQDVIKMPCKRDWWFRCHSVSNLSKYFDMAFSYFGLAKLLQK